MATTDHGSQKHNPKQKWEGTEREYEIEKKQLTEQGFIYDPNDDGEDEDEDEQ